MEAVAETLTETLTEISFTSDVWMIILVAAFICADFLTGIIQAWINACIRSHVMREGIAHKALEAGILGLSWVIQNAIIFPPALEWVDVRAMVTIYLCVMESVSILENLSKAGVWVPKFLVRRIESVKEQIDEGDLGKHEEQQRLN